MNKIETYFDKTGNVLKWENLDEYKKAIHNLPFGRYIVRIEKVFNKRSLEQNNAIFGIPYKYFEKVLTESGQLHNPSKQQIHEWCLHYCLPEDYKERIKQEWKDQEPLVDIRTGELFKTAFRLTSTKMTTVDAMTYYRNMQDFYAEFFSNGDEKDVIPDPIKGYKKDKTEENAEA
jgi:hypothetical protein